MAGTYGLTIVLTFTGLGLVTALLIGAAGAQSMAANPWVNIFIGLMLVVFGLALLGLFELRLPSNLANHLNWQSNRHDGIVGVFFMGLTLTVVSFTCTAPFVGTLLAAAAGGAWTFPLLGMLVYSTTFALPFVLLAIFPRGLSALPRSGAWMNTLKVTFGFVELAAALKFFSNADLVWSGRLLSRPLVITLTVVILSLAGLYLLGKLRMKYELAVEHVGVGRLLAAIAFFGVSLYLLPGLFGASLGRFDAYLPPRLTTDAGLLTAVSASSGRESDFAWHDDDLDAALADARQAGKPILIDFTGYTCTNCREMEANVFPHEQVAPYLRRDFVLLRLYTDAAKTGFRWQRYQLNLTGTVALPTYAIITADEELLSHWSGMASVEAFVTFLEQGLAAFNSRREPYRGKASF